MGFFHDKQQWIMSLFKNRAQHRKMQNSIQELRGELAHIRETQNLYYQEINSLKQENNGLRNSLRKLTPQANLSFVEIHLAEHCNLNCFSCSHFSQLADEEYTDLASFEKDMKQLALICGGGGDKSLSFNRWRATFTPKMQRVF
ncbi:MAG: hypothetical protein J1E31_01265 [Helicobacter sp.]|nr:hypothetical protein [Helicobacter sp.]